MMKLGLVSAILPDDTFEALIDYVADQGLSCVEVSFRPFSLKNLIPLYS